jgi:hypothetical protein
MRVSHEPTAPVTPEKAFDRLQAFIAERRSLKEPRSDMECFERELHEYVVAAERELLAEELARLDVDLPVVTIEGELYRQVVRCEESYVSAAGPVRVMRSLYRRGGKGSGRCARWSCGRGWWRGAGRRSRHVKPPLWSRI